MLQIGHFILKKLEFDRHLPALVTRAVYRISLSVLYIFIWYNTYHDTYCMNMLENTILLYFLTPFTLPPASSGASDFTPFAPS